jgi:hypothetical protein
LRPGRELLRRGILLPGAKSPSLARPGQARRAPAFLFEESHPRARWNSLPASLMSFRRGWVDPEWFCASGCRRFLPPHRSQCQQPGAGHHRRDIRTQSVDQLTRKADLPPALSRPFIAQAHGCGVTLFRLCNPDVFIRSEQTIAQARACSSRRQMSNP